MFDGDYFVELMSETCAFGHSSPFFDLLQAYQENEVISYIDSQGETQYIQIKSNREFFDFCYANFLKDNLIHAYKLYKLFNNKNNYCILFNVEDNKFIKKMYEHSDLVDIAAEVKKAMNIPCIFNNNKFTGSNKND